MGQAKRRGTYEQRVRQSQDKAEAKRVKDYADYEQRMAQHKKDTADKMRRSPRIGMMAAAVAICGAGAHDSVAERVRNAAGGFGGKLVLP